MEKNNAKISFDAALQMVLLCKKIEKTLILK